MDIVMIGSSNMITPEQLSKSGSEHSSQAALFCWAASSGIPELKWLFAIPNGGKRDARTASNLKAEGAKAGVWDIFWPLPWRHKHGLFIEMKHEKYRNRAAGGLTDAQIEFRHDLEQEYAFAICYSWTEARDAILKYLGRV